MTPTYLSVTFEMDEHDHDILQALLGEWPFESFHDEDKTIIGYIQDHDITESLMKFIEKSKGKYFQDYHVDQVQDKNWNAVWESSFNPVAIDSDYLIRAEFHKPDERKFRHIITISPKMAFGTGHHATTYMMLQAISEIDFQNKNVLDYGCGTGILAVAAAMEGAAHVIGVDIQPEAIENSEEHAKLNGVGTLCEFHLGDLNIINAKSYDVILANINRNVILDNIGELKHLMHNATLLLISGIMFDDVTIITEALDKNHLAIKERREKDQWVQLTVSSA